MKPLILAGGPAFADFRCSEILDRVRGMDGGDTVERLEATAVYFLHTAGELDAGQRARTAALLGADTPWRRDGGFFVTPRKGTISPWSSKATDIFHNCGLTAIRRIEHGVHFRLLARDGAELLPPRLGPLAAALFDRMTQGVYLDVEDLFAEVAPRPLRAFDVLGGGHEALERANRDMGLALSAEEIAYLYEAYAKMGRNPTDVELLMFGQVNSEHCRHKIFNARWVIDGVEMERTLFDMIRNTHASHPEGTLVAYSDNAAVIEGFEQGLFAADGPAGGRYGYGREHIDIVLKVETHNHPTAIAPYPGAATGVGGEIRDESATGTGGKSKAGLSAFMVSNLRVPGFRMPWERDHAEFPARLATPLAIMTEGPIGGARFGNEFGRPQLCGLFRTFEEMVDGRYRGYHKPIMVAGGIGNIRRGHTAKRGIPPGALIVQIGGPALRIGLGGGAASSMATGSNQEDLDFDSVQRDNAEMQRRCQEVIDACRGLGDANPILSIHDLGAGGLSNGCPELVAETGGHFRLREVPNEDLSMTPMEIWCCEAQERYVLALLPESLERFMALCARERCPAAVIGTATGDGRLVLEDAHFKNAPIDMELAVVLGKPPRMVRDVRRERAAPRALDLAGVTIEQAADRVLRLPSVADKTFLITIADRSVTGLVARDQMCGPYQVPVSDVAVTATTFTAFTGEAMAMGERTPAALVSGPAAGRLAVGEALMNLAAAAVDDLGNVKLSANWMCACGEPGEDASLYETVKAVGMELCPALGVSIPVGKDSLSMRTVWTDGAGKPVRMTAPLSLVVSAFAPVSDVRRTVTPDLKPGASELLLLDIGAGRNRLGGSALAQVYGQVGDACPDLDDPGLFRRGFAAVQALVARRLLLAYHDRSDGGLLVTLAEMAMAGRAGLRVSLPAEWEALPALFAEELGAVLQVASGHRAEVQRVLAEHDLESVATWIGTVEAAAGQDAPPALEVRQGGEVLWRREVTALHAAWSELTYRMQAHRDNPACARQEYERLRDGQDPGMTFHAPRGRAAEPQAAPAVTGARPRMAILREQGVNGHVEMAAAFDRAGFACVDVHMTDLLEGRRDLASFNGLVACGGFSYGDVLGAGAGWAKSVLFHDRLREMFETFFRRPDSFALGVCNGCQMLSQLKEIIPGASHWPAFAHNRSEQFEARYVTVEILPSPSVFFRGMEGERLGIAVAHGEGRADFAATGSLEAARADGLVAIRYVDNHGRPTERYPFNPNGSAGGVTGFTSADGRVTIMMPHPERGFRSVQLSYRPEGWFEGEDGPWMAMFRNARAFVGA